MYIFTTNIMDLFETPKIDLLKKMIVTFYRQLIIVRTLPYAQLTSNMFLQQKLVAFLYLS